MEPSAIPFMAGADFRIWIFNPSESGVVNEYRRYTQTNGTLTLAQTASSTSSEMAAPGMQTAQIFNLGSASNMAVTISYDTERPTVSFIAPDGTEVTTDTLSSDADDTAMVLCYYIPDAAAGQWQISYDKKSNDELDVSWAPYSNALIISQFEFATPFTGTQGTQVSFTVDSIAPGAYEYVLYAAITDSDARVTGQRELVSGRGCRAVRNQLCGGKNYCSPCGNCRCCAC